MPKYTLNPRLPWQVSHHILTDGTFVRRGEVVELSKTEANKVIGSPRRGVPPIVEAPQELLDQLKAEAEEAKAAERVRAAKAAQAEEPEPAPEPEPEPEPDESPPDDGGEDEANEEGT